MESTLLNSLFDEQERRPLSVTELNAELRGALERQFSNIWVEGEVTGFTAAASGHWYFNLNDGTSQIRCVCWKGTNFRIRFKPQNGIAIRVRGKVTLYSQRGELQLQVESLEPSGEGALRAAFEQIKAKLEGEGLFAPVLKRPIPFFPRKVAVVTSPTGAAYHDIHNVLTRRAGTVSIVLVPTLVQGEGSADSIRRAVIDANEYNQTLDDADKIDVMIVGRGGGSAEDLWAFNDELLARAIRESEIPVISAVGHEIDWTISDLVADVRAATPSAAAEIVAGREIDLLNDLISAEQTLAQLINYRLLATRGRADAMIGRLNEGFAARYRSAAERFRLASSRLTPQTLRAVIAASANDLALLDHRRTAAVTQLIDRRKDALALQAAKLNALSPLSVLVRGYSITQTADGHVLRDPAKVKPGDRLAIRLEKGQLDAEVISSE
ncbi:MAG: exodeoxyribonuclease VII large subunit [Pyrinomonadaceae bacterium]|nr:exodeoxyribonuclease VII large subunit [Pyrinomonadaceae bacterium]